MPFIIVFLVAILEGAHGKPDPANTLPTKKSQINHFLSHKWICKFGIQYMHEPTPRCPV